MECRCAVREFRPGTGIVRRLPGAGASAESEGVVEERLQHLRNGEVGDHGLVIRPARDQFTGGELVLRQAGNRLGDVVPIFLQYGRHRVELVEGRGEFGLIVVHHSRQLLSHRRGVRQQVDDRAPLPDQYIQEIVRIEDQ